MKANCNKKWCILGAILFVIIAIIVLAPLKTFKACKEANGDHSYCKHIKEHWSLKFRKAEDKPVIAADPEEPENKPADEKPEVEGKLQTVQVTEE